ncbi:acyltransferase family protein [Undibacterium sp.]|jgi:predicted acyltransferase|uniref:acyltransferase family protein n=1 Tax=Undibacterium sp. TaxID=1914977 RepID=UPI002B737E87|nr:heparan-alpha-glucosaminide N-acetyltransferase domain-containing protein [Undibacterium sp.]HTD04677.1 heparan-alpha-glucosaminide N-acetyltransferase domain-containing protein [Undibacterium sp.]
MAGAGNNTRLMSLDAFRGFTIASMLLVNNPGDWSHVYPQLDHAEWAGWTFTDWIFPFFLFIGGISMSLSLGQRAAAGADKPALLRQLARRAALIFLIGFALNMIPHFDFSIVRLPGVLQRIALCTLLAAPIVLYFNWRQQCCWILALLGAYSVVMLKVPVPDLNGVWSAGALEPGRDVGAYVDRLLLNGHLWRKVKTWDPEGLVSTIPAVCSLLFGVLTGHLLASRATRLQKTAWMVLAGLACLILGSLLDTLLMPIIKSLWTTSYCVFMTGWGLLLFSGFYYLLDGSSSERLRRFAQGLCKPFVIYGMNALFLFALSGLIARMLGIIKIAQPGATLLSLQAVLYAPLKNLQVSPVNASLIFALLFNLLMFGIAWLMWRKRWFVKV